jgi:flagellum-specific ATP synthase
VSLSPSVLAAARPQKIGRIRSAVGLSVEVEGLNASLGDILRLGGTDGVDSEVVAVSSGSVRCMPLGILGKVAGNSPVHRVSNANTVPTGFGLMGRVINALGEPIDGKGPLDTGRRISPDNTAPNPMTRTRVDRALQTGVRVIDAFTTLGRGQRIGLFAGSGVGKSSLLSMIARGTDAQVNVIALVGERGREVRAFLEDDLGPKGLARSVVVVATGDEPALMRVRAAQSATRIAESFRDLGIDVVLMMDSLTRVAYAQREIGLSVGEIPGRGGYPPSMLPLMAGLLERAGTDQTGSITGIYTVLVDGDNHNDPVADGARGILDGHIVLERSLATAGHYPAVDILASISRCATDVVSDTTRASATTIRKGLAARARMQDLIDIGAYRQGADPIVDASVASRVAIDSYLQQERTDQSPIERTWSELAALAAQMGVN